MFAWRLIKRALASGQRAARYSTHIDEHCTVCGLLETDAHTLFHCQLPRAVWFSSNPPIRTDQLTQELDGVQLILETILPASISNDLLHTIIATMWYLWKARNDNRFNRNTWTPWQVHHAVQAHLSTHLLATQDPPIHQDQPADTHQANTGTTHIHMTTTHNHTLVINDRAGNMQIRGSNNFDTTMGSIQINTQANTAQPTGMLACHAGTDIEVQENTQIHVATPRSPMMNRLTVTNPQLLPGIRCYADASTAPDASTHSTRPAGIGVFIINNQLQPPQQVYIKAKMMNTVSVIMAEAAALALAAKVTEHLHLAGTNLLSDNQKLVHFINGADISNPPEWRMKPFTQIIRNSTRQTGASIRHIARGHNLTADLLAKQALADVEAHVIYPSCLCNNQAHVH
jgi:hypothetical protein